MSLFSLLGKTALVTASVRGLGFEIAQGLAKQGARVLLNGRDEAALAMAVEQVRAQGGQAQAVVFDASDLSQFDQVMRELNQ